MPEWPRRISEEMRQHLDDEYRELRVGGATHEDAMRRLAGDVDELASMRARPADAIAGDVRFALRALRKSPGFTVVVMLTLALGIGATTAIFTVVDAVMLRPYPYPDINRIMVLRETTRTGQALSVAWPNFEDWRAQNQVFEHIGIYRPTVMNLTGGDQPERVVSSLMSSGGLSALGVQPVLGRAFAAGDDKAGTPKIAIVSDRFWRAHFNGDAAVIGKSIVLDGEPHTIVGVMPSGMRFPSRLTDVWLPLGMFVTTFPRRGAHPGLTVVAKLKPGITVQRATADMDAIARRLEQQYPMSNTDHTVTVQPYYEQVVQNIRPALLALSVAVAFVLLIACANLANLMLARSDGRQRELAIREALGATRWRVFQQLLTESLLMALGGGALGCLLAWWGVRAFVASGPTSVPRIDQVGVDLRVLVFALAVSLLTGIVFGLVPALRASGGDVLTPLKDASRGTRGSGSRTRSALIIAEVALALVLLVGAGLTLRSFETLMAVDLGFDPSRVVTMHASLPDTRYRDVPRWTAFHRELLEGMSGIPGLDAVALNSALPLAGMGGESEVRYEGQPPPSSAHEQGITSLFQAITPDYFRAMGIPVVRGRSLSEHDTADAQKVAVIEESLAQKFFPGADPIGKRIAFEFSGAHGAGAQPIWREVVGVVRHVRHYGLVKEPPNFQVYAPLEQLPLWFRERRPTMTLFARTALPPDQVIAAVRKAVARLDPDVPVFGLQTMEQYVDQATEQSRLSTTLLTLFGALALVLATLGIYGMLTYMVSGRRQEIGIRMALGATRLDVMRLIVGHGMALTLAGIAVGLGASWAVTRSLATLLVGVSPHDPATFAAVALFLAAVAFVASYVPGRRATRVDPVHTLRAE
jgi:putative ABC transport system permease protein